MNATVATIAARKLAGTDTQVQALRGHIGKACVSIRLQPRHVTARGNPPE
jgi:hypothetical protein